MRWHLLRRLDVEPVATHVTNGGIKGAVTQVDPTSGQVLAINPFDKPLAGIAVGNGAVWVANEYGTLTRIDPRTHTLTTFQLDHPLQGAALGDGVIWVSTVAPDGLLRLALPPERRSGPRTGVISRLLACRCSALTGPAKPDRRQQTCTAVRAD